MLAPTLARTHIVPNIAKRIRTMTGQQHIGKDVVCEAGQCRKRWCGTCKLQRDWSGCVHLPIVKSDRMCSKHNPTPMPLVRMRGYRNGAPVYVA